MRRSRNAWPGLLSVAFFGAFVVTMEILPNSIDALPFDRAFREAAVDVVGEALKLTVTVALALLAGAGLLVTKFGLRPRSLRDIALLHGCVVGACISVASVHLTYAGMAVMLNGGGFDCTQPPIAVPLLIAQSATILSALSLGLLFFGILSRADGAKSEIAS